MSLPPEYGSPEVTLGWGEVRQRLEKAPHYWLATVRPDGRPHVVPLDGLWVDDRWYFGGSSKTVKHRNLTAEPHAVLHLEDAVSAVIVEGTCDEVFPEDDLAAELAEQSKTKYGYGPDPSSYAQSGIWRLSPERAVAWTQFPRDATRFLFP